jgi:type II secretory ATPase GspE/PulE/Tfp pilus assembly ATPase PilB-like protein
MGIHEIVMVDTGVKKMMLENQSMDDITEYLRQTQGFQSLEASARDLVNQGETTFEEYLRVQYSVL